MGKDSDIDWTHHSANTHWGCCKVGPECALCYALTSSTRWGWDIFGPLKDRRPMDGVWSQVPKWDAAAAKAGERHRVFWNSMADVFEGPETAQRPEAYAVVQNGRERLFKLIEKTPNLNHLLLTKRPQHMREFAPTHWGAGWPPNVWAGCSAGTQVSADKWLDHLADVPAAVRFVSVEPLLEHIDLTPWLSKLHWVIVGGESGAGARPMDVEWARSVKRQCQDAGVAFFMKQLGGARDKRHDVEQFPSDLRIREFPEVPAHV